MTNDEQILKDLAKHLRRKVALNVSDFVDRCREADLDYGDCMSELMLFFTKLTAGFAAHAFNFEPNEFAKALIVAYRDAKQQEAEDRRSNQKGQNK